MSLTNILDLQNRRGSLHRYLDPRRTITAESSPLHKASSRTQTGNLWFPNEHSDESIKQSRWASNLI